MVVESERYRKVSSSVDHAIKLPDRVVNIYLPYYLYLAFQFRINVT